MQDDWFDQLRRQLHDAPPELLHRLLTEAQAQAVEDVREILRAAWREKLLTQMGDLLSQIDKSPVSAMSEPTPTPSSSSTTSNGNGILAEAQKAAVEAEIAAIRAQIAANEAQLGTTPAPEENEPPEPEESELTGTGWYLYGVTPTAVFPLPHSYLTDDPTAVEIIRHPDQPLQALVSPIPFAQFSPQQIEQADINWLAAKAEAHQNVLAAVLPHATILPLRFGTLCRTAENVQQLLGDNEAIFQQNLAALEGHHEWGVKIFFAGEELAVYVRQSRPDLRQLQTEVASQGAGTAYFGRKKIAQVVDTAVRQAQDNIVAQCHEQLTQLATATRLNSLPAKELTGKSETPLLNGAYLVPTADQTALAQQVQTLQESYAPLGFEILLTGPWPPYNFVNLDESRAS